MNPLRATLDVSIEPPSSDWCETGAQITHDGLSAASFHQLIDMFYAGTLPVCGAHTCIGGERVVRRYIRRGLRRQIAIWEIEGTEPRKKPKPMRPGHARATE